MTHLITPEHYYAFIASCAEIFGALVGLISLVYVYKTESVRSNIERAVQNLDRIAKAAKAPDDLEVHQELDVSNIGKIEEILAPHLSLSDQQALKTSVKVLLEFTENLRELQRSFRFSAVSAFAVLFFALGGLAFPYASSPGFAQWIFGLNLLLVLAASALTVNFVRQLASETHSFQISGS
ncbi:MAG: hypothetical protein KF767_13870 [Bdellovibrionaceae bacterium]|nr:hypothetical protein [Pseudobdellovibrionaceae bacterium]